MKNIFIITIIGMSLILVSSIMSIILDDGGDPRIFTTLRGEEIEVYGGEGLYKHDSVMKAVIFRGFDWANLFICFPLLGTGCFLIMRKSILGLLLLGGAFTYLAYGYLIGALGNAYNVMFLIWTAMYSAGLLGIITVLIQNDLPGLAEKIKPGFPRRTLSIYMFVLGTLLPLVYLFEICIAFLDSKPPESLAHYTTMDLAALEIGIMTPFHFIGGILLLQKRIWGHIISIILTFTAAIMYISLFTAAVFLVFFYDRSLGFLIQTLILSVITVVLSLLIIKNIQIS